MSGWKLTHAEGRAMHGGPSGAAVDLAYVAVVFMGEWRIGIAKRGVRGYVLTNWPKAESRDAAEEWAWTCNERLGHTKRSAYLIVLSSLDGTSDMATYNDGVDRARRLGRAWAPSEEDARDDA